MVSTTMALVNSLESENDVKSQQATLDGMKNDNLPTYHLSWAWFELEHSLGR